MLSNLTDAFLTYQILKRLTLPYTDWKAFKTGVIDDKGNIVIKKDKRTNEQKSSLGMFDVMILNMRKMLEKVPGGSSFFVRFGAALFLLKEENLDEKNFLKYLQNEYKNDIQLFEEIVNNVGSGNVAGMGPDDTTKNFFANHKIYDVDSNTFFKSRFGKSKSDRYKKYIDDEDLRTNIKEFVKKNPKKGVILRNKNSMIFLRRKGLMEVTTTDSISDADDDNRFKWTNEKLKDTKKETKEKQKIINKHIEDHNETHKKDRIVTTKGFFKESIDQNTLVKLEKYVNSLYHTIGIDNVFTNHFKERINDKRNNPEISVKEIIDIYNKHFILSGKKLKTVKNDVVVLKDIKSDINIPVYLEYNPKTKFLEMRAKTIIRKNDFNSPNKEIKV